MDNYNDNVYQGSSFYTPKEPTEQAQAREDEIARTLAAIPVLKDIVDHLNSRIAFYDINESIPNEVLLDPVAFMHIVTVNKLMSAQLRLERDDVLARIEDASKA